ncbi:MAG: molybdate ABC transporter substrate-binding protein [Deltaproteobacteria bacterium]|nr:molybdate ABC transporter substrate-binding protein [Deltaproteobacteria bacterium]
MNKSAVRLIIVALFLFLTVFFTLPCASAETESISVFVGAANKPPMEEIGREFELREGIKVHMTFGGSGTLLSQIELSKQGEAYLPGSPDYIIIGERKKLLIEKSEKIISYLVPAIITPKGNPANIKGLEDLTRPGVRVGIGNPESVCLGLYGIELLEKNNLLRPVLKNVVTFGASCSKTANLAALNQVDAILGWRVFHYWDPSRMELVLLKPEQIPRISYISISIPVYTKDMELSKKFLEFVTSPTGQAIYEKYGYLTSMDEAKKFSPGASIGGEYQLSKEYFDTIKDTMLKD